MLTWTHTIVTRIINDKLPKAFLQMASRLTFYRALVAVCSFAAFVPPPSSAQNTSIDGRFSPAQTLRAIGGNYSVDANLGKQIGSNLFHSFSFEKFGLSTGESAT